MTGATSLAEGSQKSKGRLKRRAIPQPSLRDWTAISLVLPNVETLGYCRASLRDEEPIQVVLELELCAPPATMTHVALTCGEPVDNTFFMADKKISQIVVLGAGF